MHSVGSASRVTKPTRKRTAARVLGNVVLAYAGAGVATLAVVSLAHLVGPGEPGPGVLGYFVNWMGLLLLGAPVLFLVLLGVDIALR